MCNTLSSQALNKTTIDHLRSSSNIASTIAIVMLLSFILQIGFGFYAFTEVTSSYRISSEQTFWVFAALLTALLITFLLFSYHRDFSDNIALAIADNDATHFGKSFLYLKKLFILQLVLTIGGPLLIILSALMD